ncbi:ABC-type transport system, ATP-binding protein [[Clostridium] sordellii]|nr:ABC-type transport system, ATP-binding protein [[Clostridium] sordellii] [Paeniclostridium sordellii]CEN81847.1 ABC transporter ATP-binding protein [[Clostridium] sordellii] [Paeniclostridium sordellii]CEO28999.1 ABC transporter ATP-binding protein [[Clostridium] sordellii] [Paeniclostridium sordellii]CEP47454.1 ABC transporter ATP-binding protein [[Clostridium] sordellii] [Paeniclostridium sordellii]CEQ23785.1 ABC transporter ATP-binding protein [[Clostridium] sordellii] [Paeniclostridium s
MMHIQMNSYQNNKQKLIIDNISKKYGASKIIEDISLHVDEGEIISILGPSGSGKSTLFNIITGLTNEYSGKIVINGKISYMQQKDLLLPYKNIIDNVSLPLLINNEKKIRARERVKKYFEEFGLEGYEYNYPSELSGGMRQRVNFLRTFINSKDLMLLDEPFAALDSITKSKMQEWLINVKGKFNSTILLITHDIDEAIKLSNRIYLLSDKPAKVKKEFNLKYANYDFGNENYINLKKEIISLL